MDAVLEALPVVMDPSRLGWVVLGVGVGSLVGLLPGLGGVAGMSILLPFVFGMDPYTGIALLIGMLAVTNTTDTFPSVLLGVPGSSGSQATIMDGYPLAQQGEARRALGAAFLASMIGGVFGALYMFGGLFVARPVVLSLGSPELFMLTVLGISMIGVMTRGAPLAGLLAALAGVLLGTIGGARGTAEYRFTFDWLYLHDGIPLAVLALGLFAVPELIDLVAAKRKISATDELGGRLRDGAKDAVRNKGLILGNSAIGSFVGMLPGIGGAAINWIAYGLTRQTRKDASKFGKGDIRGVIAPESANNAAEGGGLLPTLMFGIPGSGGTAVLLGGLLILGLRPGPSMVTSDLDVTLTVIWTLAIANVMATLLCFGLSTWVAKLSMIPAARLTPFLLVILVAASYQSTLHWGDIILLFAFAALGWTMKQVGWPRPPLLIGFVLATPLERYLNISYSRYEFDWLAFPSVIALGAGILILTVGLGVGRWRAGRRTAKVKDEGPRST